MTEEELTNWEHRSDVIRVLTSYEMGAWLHRRDKRLLQKIRAEIEQSFDGYLVVDKDKDYASNTFKGQPAITINHVFEIIDKYRTERR